jgi:CheY-like chemotaxis protein
MRPAVADSGPRALRALESALDAGSPFQLVLLDVHMPDMDGFAVAERIRSTPGLAGATIMMLTSSSQRGDAARCRELGVSVHLTKPIGQSELLGAIRKALAGAGRRLEAAPPVAGGEVRAAAVIRRHAGLHILLAEDNPVNQKLAARLRERRGHRVTVVADGRRALAARAEGRFDLVLMDVQMPEMDGFEAKAAIRDLERETGSRTPIVAMTARAMQGDRARCLEAGMDGYVSKPVRPAELYEVIEGAVAGTGTATSTPASR